LFAPSGAIRNFGANHHVAHGFTAVISGSLSRKAAIFLA
jgi:hypothetical protein